MKIKGLTKTLEMLDDLDQEVDEKLDRIEWDGKNNKRDHQKDEMFCVALNQIEEARSALEEIIALQLEHF